MVPQLSSGGILSCSPWPIALMVIPAITPHHLDAIVHQTAGASCIPAQHPHVSDCQPACQDASIMARAAQNQDQSPYRFHLWPCGTCHKHIHKLFHQLLFRQIGGDRILQQAAADRVRKEHTQEGLGQHFGM